MNDTLKRMLLCSLLAVLAPVTTVSLMWVVNTAFGYESTWSHGLSGLPFLELIFGGAAAGLASTRFQLTRFRQRVQRQESLVYRTLLGSLHGFLTGFIYGVVAGGTAGALYIIGQATNPQVTASGVEVVRYIIFAGIGGAWVIGLIGGIANSIWQAFSVPLTRFKPSLN